MCPFKLYWSAIGEPVCYSSDEDEELESEKTKIEKRKERKMYPSFWDSPAPVVTKEMKEELAKERTVHLNRIAKNILVAITVVGLAVIAFAIIFM